MSDTLTATKSSPFEVAGRQARHEPSSNFSGEVWINLKIERLTTLMAHLRKLATAKLKAAEFLQTKKLLQSIVIPDNALEKAKPLQKGTDASETNLQRQKPWARQQLVWAKLWPP